METMNNSQPPITEQAIHDQIDALNRAMISRVVASGEERDALNLACIEHLTWLSHCVRLGYDDQSKRYTLIQEGGRP